MAEEPLTKKRKLERKQAKKDAKKKKLKTQLSSSSLPSPSKIESEAHLPCWTFDVDYNDHFETPQIAYRDILPLLTLVANSLRKRIEDLVIYDPYFCQGKMVSHLTDLGFKKVINVNKDFYNDIKHGRVPAHDVLVTNPPYSGEHKLRLLRYLNDEIKAPFFLLLPAYTATKSYWRNFVATSEGANTCYLMPPNSYNFNHPEGTGKSLPPFYSSWFCGRLPFQLNVAKGLYESTTPEACRRGVGQQSCILLGTVEEMEKGEWVAPKRLNPKRRNKIKNKS